ncbi:MAG: hypothetical protein DRI97_02650 [Bacteroidetes bacterium]|nr:MAG: hypothetical protein DRI97_02650 [Bacteroidota bacterium]RLD93904.1 MAG: hypothetical protein DRJ29_07410 [Bacteroidota bacterium]
MKNNMLRNFALMLAVALAFSSCASTKVAKDPHAPYLGEWDYQVLELPVDIDGTFVISKEEGVLKATMVNPMGDIPLEEITIVENVLKSEFEVEGNFIELEGTFDGNVYSGFLFVQGGEFEMKMTKKE